MVLVVQNPPGSAGDIRDTGSIPGLGRSPGEGNGNPLQYSCLENFMDASSASPSRPVAFTQNSNGQFLLWLSLPGHPNFLPPCGVHAAL